MLYLMNVPSKNLKLMIKYRFRHVTYVMESVDLNRLVKRDYIGKG